MNRKSVFHVHTYRCGHASMETEAEYIEKAIELGAEEIVFTDHCPFPGNPFLYRMDFEQLENYVSTLQELKQHFASQIAVKIGLETEYLPSYQKYYEELLSSKKFDLLIIGPHFYERKDGTFGYSDVDKLTEIKGFAKSMIQGMESGLFPVLAHPDRPFTRVEEWNEEINEIVRSIAKAAITNRVMMECNLSSIHEGLYFPEFWKNVPKEAKIVYGLDAHSVKDVEKYYPIAQKLIEET